MYVCFFALFFLFYSVEDKTIGQENGPLGGGVSQDKDACSEGKVYAATTEGRKFLISPHHSQIDSLALHCHAPHTFPFLHQAQKIEY